MKNRKHVVVETVRGLLLIYGHSFCLATHNCVGCRFTTRIRNGFIPESEKCRGVYHFSTDTQLRKYSDYDTGWSTEKYGFDSRKKKHFSHTLCPDRLRILPSLLFNACQDSFFGLRRPGHEADHSPPSKV
jgi:hypothetical protein